jgi:hypothetical protein
LIYAGLKEHRVFVLGQKGAVGGDVDVRSAIGSSDGAYYIFDISSEQRFAAG